MVLESIGFGAVTVGIFGAIYGLLVCRDIAGLSEYLCRSEEGSVRSDGLRGVRMYTSLGGLARRSLVGLRAQIAWQGGGELSPRIAKTLTFEPFVVKREHAQEFEREDREAESHSFYSRLIDLIRQQWGADSAALLLLADGSITPVVSSDQGASALGRALSTIFLPLFSSRPSSLLGMNDSEEAQGDFGPLRGFGVRWSLASVVRESLPGGSERVSESSKLVVWLGYREGRRPSVRQVIQLQELCESLRVTLSQLQAIYRYSKRCEKVEHEIQEREREFRYVSHDLRSPLANVSAILQQVKTFRPDSGFDDLLEAGILNCDGVVELIDALNDLAAHRRGSLKPAVEPINASRCVEAVCRSYQVAASNRGLYLQVDVDEMLWILHDRRHFRRILSNLVNNAIKFTRSGGVKIGIRREGESGCLITVEDTGIGIGTVDLKRVFEPFVRLHQTIEGSGLGLAVVKILVSVNGGDISVHSTPNVGTRFSIFLPHGALASLPKPGRVQTLVHVLIVDDSTAYLSSLAKLLRDAGYLVDCCSLVADAFNHLQRAHYHGVIVDAHLPDGCGEDIISFIQAANLSSRTMVLTGESGMSGSAADRVVVKPASLGEIVDWLRGDEFSAPQSVQAA